MAKIALIIGGHPCAQVEAAHFRKMYGGHIGREIVTFGVNHAIATMWCDYLVSHHPDIMGEEYPTFRGAKFTGFLNFPPYEGWLHLDHNVGSSALLAVHVARAMMCEKIILCGVHLDDPGYSIFQKSWEREAHLHAKYLRSMGGWTKELFGAPSRDWLEG